MVRGGGGGGAGNRRPEAVLGLPSVTIFPEKPPQALGKCEEIAYLSSRRVPWAIRIISSHLDFLSGIP